MFALFPPLFRQPFGGEIAAPGIGIFDDVARDIRHLKGKAEIACPVERVAIVFRHVHHLGHHYPDGARDVIAIAQHVPLVRRRPSGRVEGEAGNDVVRHVRGQSAFVRHHAEAVKGRIGSRLFGESAAGEDSDRLHAVFRTFQIALIAQRAALVLIVRDIVAPAAPGIEQPCPLARPLVEQLGRGGEALRAFLDRLPGLRHHGRAIATAARLDGRVPHETRGYEGTLGAQRSEAFMLKIGVWGS